jgi:hypothetical protein
MSSQSRWARAAQEPPSCPELELGADRRLEIQRAIADGGDWGGPAWTDALPGGMAGRGAREVAVGGRPGSTTTRVPTRTRR